MSAAAQNITHSSALQMLSAFTALLIGGAIYLAFRTEKLLLFRVMDTMGLGEQLRAWRHSITLSLPEWAIYNLPGALWSSAYILTVDAILKSGSTKIRLLVASIIPAIGVTSELLQIFGIMPGTFDFLDILAYAIPYTIYALIINTTQK